MRISNGNCLHVVLYGTFNENRYFLGEFKDSFDLIGFNANIIAYAPDSMALFAAKLSKKAFFIDPQTHAFQQPVRTIMRKKDGEWVVKDSIKKLAHDHYGSVIAQAVGINSISAGSLSDREKALLCENVLAFEYSAIHTRATEDEELKEFLDFQDVELRPVFLVAPYFYLEPDALRDELKVNIDLVNKSASIIESSYSDSGLPLFAEVVIAKEVLLDPKKLNEVLDRYAECASNGLLVWIDDFSEMDESRDSLRKYYDMLSGLGRGGKPIIVLRGSYFSIVQAGQARKVLAGVGHGIEYGEHRSVVPVGGGVPLAKFYFPRFHKRVNYHPDAENVLIEKRWARTKETFHSEVCGCPMCRDLIVENVQDGFSQYGLTNISPKDGKAYPTAQAMDKSRRHYLNTKQAEYDFCRQASFSDIINELQASSELAKDIKSHSFDHLSKWVNVLRGPA